MSKLPKEIYDTFVQHIEQNKDRLIQHYISEGNVLSIGEFWDNLRRKIRYNQQIEEYPYSYLDIDYLDGQMIESNSIIIIFGPEGKIGPNTSNYSTFKLIIK